MHLHWSCSDFPVVFVCQQTRGDWNIQECTQRSSRQVRCHFKEGTKASQILLFTSSRSQPPKNDCIILAGLTNKRFPLRPHQPHFQIKRVAYYVNYYDSKICASDKHQFKMGDITVETSQGFCPQVPSIATFTVF